MNIKADCGFNPGIGLKAENVFELVSVKEIKDEEGFSLEGRKNMIVNLSSENTECVINDFVGMEEGKLYTLVATNGANKRLRVKLPQATTVYNSNVTAPIDGMNLVYTFFTDGYSIFCNEFMYVSL